MHRARARRRVGFVRFIRVIRLLRAGRRFAGRCGFRAFNGSCSRGGIAGVRGGAGAEAVSADAASAVASGAPSASPARAASAAQLAPIVVTARRGPQRLADAIPQTTLFDARDIADSGATDLPGLLALAPGAQIVRNGGPGASASLSCAARSRRNRSC